MYKNGEYTLGGSRVRVVGELVVDNDLSTSRPVKKFDVEESTTGDLTVSGAARLEKCYISEDALIQGTMVSEDVLTDKLVVNDELSVTGQLSAGTLTTGTATVSGDLTVANNASVSGNLTVNGPVKEYFWYGKGAPVDSQNGAYRFWHPYGYPNSVDTLGVTITGGQFEMPSSYVIGILNNDPQIQELTVDGKRHGISPDEAGWYHIDYYATYHEKFGNNLSYPRLFLKTDRLYRVAFLGSATNTGYEIVKVKSSTVQYLSPDIGVALLAHHNTSSPIRWGVFYIKITKLF